MLKPEYTVLWAAFFNFIAFAVFGLHVAQTVGTGIVEPHVIDAQVIFAALIGAIAWNVITWVLGIPSSSSHALIGGLLGAGVAKVGIGAIVWSGVIKPMLAIFASPATGLMLVLVLAVAWTSLRLTPLGVDRHFRKLQFVSAALYSLGHGDNGAQKTMGIIAVLLYLQGLLVGGFYVPFWVVLSCQAAMPLGTLSGGGGSSTRWGRRSRGLRPHRASAQKGVRSRSSPRHSGASRLIDAHRHRRDRRRRRRAAIIRGALERAGTITVAWIVTLPAAAAIGAATYFVTGLFR